MLFRRFSLPIALAGALFASGCRDREIVVYRAPKDPPPRLPGPAAAGPAQGLPEGHPPLVDSGNSTNAPLAPMPMNAPVPTAEGADLTWTAPANWQPKELGPMRKGSFNVPGAGGAAADLAITAFPGDTGGLVANINRWRGQVGLPAVDAAQAEASVEKISANGLSIALVDLGGTVNGQPTRLLGAIVPHEGSTWFFKLLGPDATVTGEKPAFRAFLDSLRARAP